MDPEVALSEIRKLIAEINRLADAPAPRAPDLRALRWELVASRGMALATLVEGIDGWMSRGGFAPKAWERR